MNMIDIIEGCSRKKWKIKKQEQNHPNKEKLQKRSREFYINLSEDEKIKKK